MEEYRALLDRVLARFRALSRDIAANLSDEVPEEAAFKLAFKDYFDAFGRFYNSTYNDWLSFRSSTEEAQTFDVGLDDWRARYQTISGLEPSNPNVSESDTWRSLRLLGWGALGVGALFGVGWLVASAVKGASAFKPSLTIGDPPRLRVGQTWTREDGAKFKIVPRRQAVDARTGRLRKGYMWGRDEARGHTIRPLSRR